MTARLVGINHVALDVGDIEEALAFYGQIFELRLRGREPGMAFIDAGDQFIALSERSGRARPAATATSGSWSTTRTPSARRSRRPAPEIVPSRGLDFRDPWGNLVQVVDYRDIQFTKAPAVLRAMGLEGLSKGPARARASCARRASRSAASAAGRRRRGGTDGAAAGARHRRDLRIHELVRLIILLVSPVNVRFDTKTFRRAHSLRAHVSDVRHRGVVTCRVRTAVVAPEPR